MFLSHMTILSDRKLFLQKEYKRGQDVPGNLKGGKSLQSILLYKKCGVDGKPLDEYLSIVHE